MKIAPFKYELSAKPRPFWTYDGRFWRYEPDFLIALLNQLLFFGVIVLVFFLAKQLFDAGVAWLSAVIMLGTELFWRFSVSGLSTMLLLLVFTGLFWCLTLLEREAREPKWGQRGILILAAAGGLLVAIGGLTRYAFAWIIIPVVAFIVLFCGNRRIVLALLALAVFLALMTPWTLRTYNLSGAPFGTATYSVIEGTGAFPEYKLQRALEPEFTRVVLRLFWQKLFTNMRGILQTDLLKLGGSWIGALFLAGLLIGFRNPATRRLRYFVLLSLGVLVVVQALGRTQLSEDSPEINSENLLVLLAPFVIVYGVSLFFVLLDQMNLLFPEARYIVIGGFAALICLPMFLVFLPPKTQPVAYPPYYPPAIQNVANWTKESELSMTDIPWAYAWYGNRQAVWLTLNAQSDFFAIYDYQRPISMLYLTPQTMDSRFLSQWVRAGEQSWGSFILESLIKKEVPPLFPLRKSPTGFLPEQLVLTDWERWKRPE
jgi:4-amino-4-deoxy-L-arabinose transferase-like glycosyltransferase